jgi:NAD(P)-dependent dehydrogenase (short-subunit alcohol dehydrogenase family)
MAAWQQTLDVDLRAVLVGTHLAVRHMTAGSTPGVIVSVASAAGVFALPEAPVYTAAKGGLVHFTRGAAKAQGHTHRHCLSTICGHCIRAAGDAGHDRAKVWRHAGAGGSGG